MSVTPEAARWREVSVPRAGTYEQVWQRIVAARAVGDACADAADQWKARCDELTDALRDALELLVEACEQGTGETLVVGTTWHHFLSTYEDVDDRLPGLRRVLGGAAEPEG